jgi:hypothetical protein
MFGCSWRSRHFAMAASLGALMAAVPNEAEAAWPKVLDIEVCWDFVCNGTTATWTLFADGTFADQYASTGDYYLKSQFPGWPYAEDFLLFYDNGQTSYTGNAPEPVSISEFINTPNGQEWVELYNYSKKPINVSGWSLSVGAQSVSFGNITIPARSHVVVTSSTANFIAQWGVGTVGVDLFQVALPALPNGAGSLALADAGGDPVWQLTFADDEDPGFSTVLTELNMLHFTHPAVDRSGNDDVDGYTGYESYAVHNDSFDFSSTLSDRGSPLSGPRGTARPLFTGNMVTYVFYPPYIIEGMWCELGC